MLNNRLALHEVLCEVLGSRQAYFQPPESIKMQYPAIVYNLTDINNAYADDTVYSQSLFYEITVLDLDPDSEIVSKVSKLPGCRFITAYAKDGLNHTRFKIYY